MGYDRLVWPAWRRSTRSASTTRRQPSGLPVFRAQRDEPTHLASGDDRVSANGAVVYITRREQCQRGAITAPVLLGQITEPPLERAMVGCDNLVALQPVSGLWTEGAPPDVVCAHCGAASVRQVLPEPGVRVLLRLARAGLCPGTPPVLREAGDD